MCGIVGIWQREKCVDRREMLRMRDAMKHRGPDDAGLWVSPCGRVALGFRRLSIIDLSKAGNQPIPNEDQTKWIVFNGELYNFRALRQKLEKSGHRFRSQGDSEVVLHAYEEFGSRCLQHFHGMFGFGIWSENQQRFFLARDRFGIKPLYYYFDGNVFLFASEIKALLEHASVSREMDQDAFEDYLTYGYVPHDKAIFKNVKKLPAAHCLVFENGVLTVQKYWELEYSPKERSDGEFADELRQKIEEAVKLWTVSDVPVGVFLSGGMDSSAVCSMIAHNGSEKVQTYAIGFDNERQNELRYARMIAREFHTEHHERIVSVNDAQRVLATLVEAYDEPFYDTSSVPTYYVSKFARESVKVVLTGDGGDELFFGYHWYEKFLQLEQKHRNNGRMKDVLATTLINAVRCLPAGARIAALEKHTTPDPVRRYFRLVGFFDEWEKRRLLDWKASVHHKDALWLFRMFYKADLPTVTALRVMDMNTYLIDDILTKVDRASMANSLEVRTPLLEHELAEFIMTIPVDMIYRHKQPKYIFKHTMQGVLPKAILQRGKKGFSAPIRTWLRGELAGYAQQRLINGYAVCDGLLQPKAISAMIQNFTENRWAKLWLLLIFEEWYRRWVRKMDTAQT